jgi:hypothetical protein
MGDVAANISIPWLRDDTLGDPLPRDRSPAPATWGGKQNRRARVGLSIQSKLLIMLLSVSLASSVIVGIIGFVSARESLRAAAFDQLTTIRELRTEEIEHEFASLQQGVRLDSRNGSAVEAATAFIDGFAQLQTSTLTAEEEATLDDFYAASFVPALEERADLDYDPAAFIPATPAGRYLQAKYTATRAYDDYDTGLRLDDAGDGSAWSAAGARYGSYFTGLVDELGYEDVLVLDRDANVVYSAYKSVDLGGGHARRALHELGADRGVQRGAARRQHRRGGHDRLRALPPLAQRAHRVGGFAGRFINRNRRRDGGAGAHRPDQRGHDGR